MSGISFQGNGPQPADTAPPPVSIDSATGSSPKYALADHTHESRLQARRIQVTPDASGRYVYVFPKAYPAGIIPIINATAETPTGVTYRNDISILQDSTTNTQTTLVVTRLAQSQTVSVLGAVLTLFPASHHSRLGQHHVPRPVVIAHAYCRASETIEEGLASPIALLGYIVARVALAYTLEPGTVTVILSDFANVMLILIAAAQYRKGKVMEREVDAVAEALPGVDHEAIRAEA